MEIKNINNIAFGTNVKTVQLFETLLMRNFKSESINGFKEVTHTLYPKQGFVGCRGYRYYAQQIRNAVLNKYPQIADDVKIISKILAQNPKLNNSEIENFVYPYIKKYGEYIDINI